MRGIISYLVGGIFVVLALAMIAPAAWLGLPVRAWPVAERGSAVQSVDRSHKSDRLNLPVTVVGKKPSTTISKQETETPIKPVKILDGCDPVFSPLSSSAQANLPGRCAV